MTSSYFRKIVNHSVSTLSFLVIPAERGGVQLYCLLMSQSAECGWSRLYLVAIILVALDVTTRGQHLYKERILAYVTSRVLEYVAVTGRGSLPQVLRNVFQTLSWDSRNAMSIAYLWNPVTNIIILSSLFFSFCCTVI